MSIFSARRIVERRLKALGVPHASPEVIDNLIADEESRRRARSIGLSIGILAAITIGWLMDWWPPSTEEPFTLMVMVYIPGVIMKLADVSYSALRIPKTVDPTRRIARIRAMNVSDYLHPPILIIYRIEVAAVIASASYLTVLSHTSYVDFDSTWHISYPLCALLVMAYLAFVEIAARRIIKLPAPASSNEELFLADARRAEMLACLVNSAGFVAWGALLFFGSKFGDISISVARHPEINTPLWVQATIAIGRIITYLLGPLALVVVAIIALDTTWFARRLWCDRAGAAA